MTTQHEAYQKWRNDFESDYDQKPSYFQVWQAATTEANKRMAELEGEVAFWQGKALENGFAYAKLFKEFVELQANNDDLREALKTIAIESHEELWQREFAFKALSATPAESLQEKYNESLEKSANIAIKTLRPDLGIAVAKQLRSQKEVK